MKSKVWKKKWKNNITLIVITLIVASIKSAKFRCSTSVEHHFPTGPSLTQKCFKNIQLSEGVSPPKNDYFAKKFLPRDWSSRKPPVYDFWAHFLKTEILLSMTLSENIKKWDVLARRNSLIKPVWNSTSHIIWTILIKNIFSSNFQPTTRGLYFSCRKVFEAVQKHLLDFLLKCSLS